MTAPLGGSVLVVGGTGFIGRAVLGAMTRQDDGRNRAPRLHVLSRRVPTGAGSAAIRHVRGDLADPRSLRGVCSEIDTVVHAASYVGRDPQQCHDVNQQGTRALLEEARRAGVRRFIYLSTASVYGEGPHRGPAEGEVEPAPASPASSSRLRAEQEVRAAGGTVLRPHLIYGEGDRWFVPAVSRLLRLVPAWPAGATSLSSVIEVGDLARVVAALVDGAGVPGEGGTYHVAHPRPLSMARLLAELRSALRLPAPRRVPAADHRALVRQSLPGLTDHQYALLTQDHWYDTSSIWGQIGLDPGPGFEARFAACSAWYREQSAHVLGD
ncbi:NAD-dependent epimerase/dehydratase family protein [Streptomyces sp. BB1-1-1]|uniref:NAD-dependent epimerase/dehydratase family protein n=1 Tax=Streptomyces sp. BB1-1-1 TaxID=3074430 RepID=UPI0028776766|nr:NAD-dependent epimerase/dehydratase family protein [Streptomyces sp. BB1-1-1]WND33045.1 NAD-dependent epimerase/dehydratase family protein [Streptomyces sp. BB1-1-1]